MTLKASPAGKSYVLWQRSGSALERLGSFGADGGKDCAFFLQLSHPILPGIFEVTLEDSKAGPQVQQGPLYLRGQIKP